MQNAFRTKHLLEILEGYDLSRGPLDLYLRKIFTLRKQIGSKDRKEITDVLYSLIRYKDYFDYFSTKPYSWQKRLFLFKTHFPIQDNNGSIPPHIQVSYPNWLFALLQKSLQEKTLSFCINSNENAPLTIRCNPLKTTRSSLAESLRSFTEISLCKHSPLGITLKKRINLQELFLYREGHFTIQDEASQLISFLIATNPGEKVLDYCCGSGGKSLAFAPLMQNKGLLCLHDIRQSALLQAKKRFKKSGVQNVQFFCQEKGLKTFTNQMDWVLLDVPCTGTGTLRRNPEMKWKIDKAMVDDLCAKQRQIFKNSFSYAKPKGKIVYATCSVLQEENEKQIAHFLQQYPIKLVEPFFKTLPEKGGMDGFFGAILQKTM